MSIYQNELEWLALYNAGEWKNIKPLQSDYNHVISALGKPMKFVQNEYSLLDFTEKNCEKFDYHIEACSFSWRLSIKFIQPDSDSLRCWVHFPDSLQSKVLYLYFQPDSNILFSSNSVPSCFKVGGWQCGERYWDSAGLEYLTYEDEEENETLCLVMYSACPSKLQPFIKEEAMDWWIETHL